jgi:hypothetical protein
MKLKKLIAVCLFSAKRDFPIHPTFSKAHTPKIICNFLYLSNLL